ncbi:uncharacterized protein LOC116416182 [Nasonia vitripennis]|uniref:DUF4371 domain-containing protein n=1 Tax=Nasonia vitripennis TaxID=7425 RepID=A0A7M7Q374_NASVI|nr:uncharacterized protein LOC116416182 [Nasonia vitripennis]
MIAYNTVRSVQILTTMYVNVRKRTIKYKYVRNRARTYFNVHYFTVIYVKVPIIFSIRDERIDEHEKSIAHKNCADSFFLGQNNSNAAQLLFTNDNSLRNKEVTKNRKILERIVDIIKLIGKRGLSYRGNKVEAAYTLEDNGVDHGNFLEILLLLAKYDSILQNHIKECINKSKMYHSLKPAGKIGRGNFVSMLSKTTINHILDIIANLVKNTIAKEINATKMFSIQIDTTQDITSKVQCSIITHYVNNNIIYERLLSMVHVSRFDW